MGVITAKRNGKVAEERPRVRPTAAEVYQAQPYYQRFNQKFNMTRQRLRSPEWLNSIQEQGASLRRLAAQGKPGYSPLDLAFYLASRGNLINTGFSINAPNVRGNAWRPLSKSRPAQPWQGSPAETTQALCRVGRLFGADMVACTTLDRRWVYSHYFNEEKGRDYPIKFTDEPGYEHHVEPGLAENGALVIPKEMRYAVVMLFEMDEEGMARAPTVIQRATTLATYSRIAFTTVMVAEFLRGWGITPSPAPTAPL